MGDRGNIRVRYEGHDDVFVHFYTHWRGSALPQTLHAALAKRWRWDDPAYLARIVFCEMVRGYEGSETGYGIGLGILDNEHPIVTVDTKERRVEVEGFGSWTYDEYVALDIAKVFAEF